MIGSLANLPCTLGWLEFSDWVLLIGMTLVVAALVAHKFRRSRADSAATTPANDDGDGGEETASRVGARGAMLTVDESIDDDSVPGSRRSARSIAPSASAASPPPPRLTASERVERDRQERAMRRDLDSLATEIEDMARRVGDELEQRAAKLERLIQSADQRIAQLENAAKADADSGSAKTREPAVAAITPRLVVPPPSPSSPPLPTAAPAVNADTAANNRRPASHDLVDDPLTRRVHELADRGQGAAEIAQSLNEHVGKVELILALRSVAGG